MTEFLFEISGLDNERVTLQTTKEVGEFNWDTNEYTVDMLALKRKGFDGFCRVTHSTHTTVNMSCGDELAVIVWKKYPWSKSRVVSNQRINCICKNGWLKSAFIFITKALKEQGE